MITIIGIDPGLDGAIAFFTDGRLNIFDMKKYYSKTGSKKKKKYNALNFDKFCAFVKSEIVDVFDLSETHVFCEESMLVHGNGIKTNRSIYESVGVMKSAFSRFEIPVMFVEVDDWKQHFGLLQRQLIPSEKQRLRKLPKADRDREKKQRSIEAARKRFPKGADCFEVDRNGHIVMKDGRAEAALIALYGWNKENH